MVSALLVLSAQAFAQNTNANMGDFAKQWQERLESEKIAFLTNEMSLTPKEAQAFWRRSDDFEMILLTEDGEILLTEGLEERFTPADSWLRAPLTVIRHD